MTGPWIEAFRRDPNEAVADLFSGRVGVGSSLRLDVPEMLYQAFSPSLIDEREQLDQALLSWLLAAREDYASQVRRLGFPAYGKRIGDALIALQLLELPDGRRRIREDLSAWLRWLRPLRLAPERDPALECLRLLTRGQPDGAHTSLWLRLAADPRREYLAVALAGLQLLPNEDNTRRNQTLMLQALLRHAVKTHHEASGARTFFNRRYAALRGLFPRGPQHWNRVLDEALDGFLKYTNEQVAVDLVDVLRTTMLARHSKSSNEKTPAIRPVTQEEWSDLQSDIIGFDHPPETLSGRLFEILEQNHDYAVATGVSHFFVRTLHNLGHSLLERYQLVETDMTRFGLMIERSLVWEPTDPYSWMLWARWFRDQGRRDAHEATLREMLRLFPGNAVAQIELARLLIVQGEDGWDEAEHWLNQAREQDSDGGRSQEVMDQLLNSRRRRDEIVEFLERHPDDKISRRSLDRLRSGVYVGTAANALGNGRDSEIKEAIGSGGERIRLSGAVYELCRRGTLAGEFSRAQIAKARGQIAPADSIRQEALRGDPLAGFYSQWLLPEETPECPPHAWAWNACRHWQDLASVDRWRHLAENFPEAIPETEFLRVLSATDDGDQAAERWRVRYGSDNGTARRAVDVYMRQAQKRLASADPSEREEIAVAVMACEAADALELAADRAA